MHEFSYISVGEHCPGVKKQLSLSVSRTVLTTNERNTLSEKPRRSGVSKEELEGNRGLVGRKVKTVGMGQFTYFTF